MNDGWLSLWNFPNPLEWLATSLYEEVVWVVIYDSDCVKEKEKIVVRDMETGLDLEKEADVYEKEQMGDTI